MLILTLDTNWAPQFVIDHALAILDEYDIPATFFCTSPYIFPPSPIIEQALYPNLMPDSTQGVTEKECLYAMRSLYPDAVGIRTHRLYWHGLLPGLFKNVGMRYDSSLFLPLQSHLCPYFEDKVIRYPIWWTDFFHMQSGFCTHFSSTPGLDEPGMKVLLFHPLYIYLNTIDINRAREKLQRILIPKADAQRLAPLRSAGKGAERLFRSALEYMACQPKNTLLAQLSFNMNHERIQSLSI